VPLSTAVPLQVVGVVPVVGPTVFVPSVKAQFVKVSPTGEPVHVIVSPRVAAPHEIEGGGGESIQKYW
jgi:hypothetical protein